MRKFLKTVRNLSEKRSKIEFCYKWDEINFKMKEIHICCMTQNNNCWNEIEVFSQSLTYMNLLMKILIYSRDWNSFCLKAHWWRSDAIYLTSVKELDRWKQYWQLSNDNFWQLSGFFVYFYTFLNIRPNFLVLFTCLMINLSFTGTLLFIFLCIYDVNPETRGRFMILSVVATTAPRMSCFYHNFKFFFIYNFIKKLYDVRMFFHVGGECQLMMMWLKMMKSDFHSWNVSQKETKNKSMHPHGDKHLTRMRFLRRFAAVY